MELQASPTPRLHVSECPLPEIPETAVFETTYVVAAPSLDTCELLHQAATELIAAAGLPKMDLTVTAYRYRDGRRAFTVLAYDADGQRNPLDVCSANGFATCFDECLRRLAASLLRWAMEAGLVNEPTMEGSRATV